MPTFHVCIHTVLDHIPYHTVYRMCIEYITWCDAMYTTIRACTYVHVVYMLYTPSYTAYCDGGSIGRSEGNMVSGIGCITNMYSCNAYHRYTDHVYNTMRMYSHYVVYPWIHGPSTIHHDIITDPSIRRSIHGIMVSGLYWTNQYVFM